MHIQRNGIFFCVCVCMCAITYCMYNIEDRHNEIRFDTFNKIISKWEYHKKFIVDISMANNAEDYKTLLSRDGLWNVELTHLSFVF